MMPTLYIIAGPNGAGKTTAAYSLLPEIFTAVEFVNADEIAKGLSPLNPEGVAFEAGRIMLRRLNQLINEKKNFAFETTLSGLAYLKFIEQAKAEGFEVVFFFVHLHSFQLAQNRVAFRVQNGGHNIPPEVIERRYNKGLRNFITYQLLANDWYVFDNSGMEYVPVARGIASDTEIYNFEIYQKLVTYGKGE
ncbi:MAG: zeta toxin [Chitinophagaceae bacterium]|nr:MAG: zeta toxin [Chitinophagaceae bacterium]